MMQLLSLAAVALYCAVSLGVGVRLLLLARRTGEWPEFLIGAGFLCGGMIGYPFSVVANAMTANAPETAQIANALGQAGMGLATVFILFSWRVVFAPDLRGGTALTALWAACILGLTLLVILTTSPGPERFSQNTYWPALAAQASAYAVNAIASLRYASMLRRRLEIGLGDPVVANRIRLWGVAGLAITVQYLYALASILVVRVGLPAIYHPLTIAILGIGAATCIALAFFPSHAYTERIRAAAAGGRA